MNAPTAAPDTAEAADATPADTTAESPTEAVFTPAPAAVPLVTQPAAPAPTPPQPSPLDEVANVALDSADLANRGAQAASAAANDLRHATEAMRAHQGATHKQAKLLLFSVSGAMVVCMIFFLIIGIRMNSRINQLDEMMLAVGKRVVDLNVGMESLTAVNTSVAELAKLLAELSKTTAQVSTRIEEASKQSEALAKQVPTKTAEQVATANQNLSRQVEGINSRLQAQATATQNLGREVQSLKGTVGNVDKLNRDVQALVTLQRERYLEALQKSQATNDRERAVQFPRQQPAVSPNTGAPSSGPAMVQQPRQP